MHAAGFDDWEWNEGNQQELARHHITPDEVEQVAENEPTWARNKRNRAGKWLMIGRTFGGRALTIVIALGEAGTSARAITGWDSTRGEHTRYLRR